MIKSKDIKIVPIELVIPNEKNRNNHSEEQLKVLEKIVKSQGFRDPIVVSNRSGKIVSGHARLIVAQRLKYKEVPVSYQDFDSDAQEYKHLIAANEIARYAEFDKLNFLEDIKGIGDVKDIDFEEFGLIDFKIPRVQLVTPEEENEVPNTSGPIITRKGDVWILDNHRIMCGDSTMIDDLDKLMKKERAQVLFTSPPYNAGDEVKTGKTKQKYETHDDKMAGDSYFQLLCDFTSNALMNCDLVMVNIQQLSGNKIQFVDYLNKFKNNLVDICIWNKVFGTPCLPKNVMNSAFEYVLFFSNENNPPKTIKTTEGFHGTVQNVYNGAKNSGNEFSEIHRATFPVHLPEHFIKTFSTGSVLDLFNGTGTTMIACEKLGRNYFGMDMDPLYVDVTINRWQKLTGKSAKLESTGETFDELKSRFSN